MSNRVVVLCIDGLDPEYLEACEAHVLNGLGGRGFLKLGRSMMPSVTNVNNVSLVTGAYPEEHGICSNYRLVRETGEEVYMESGEYVLVETIFQRAARLGKGSILVTSKDKLRTLIGDGAAVSVSSERPPQWLVDELGPAPDIYSLEVNAWAVAAANLVMERHPAELTYISTTDYAMHTYAPDEPQARRHMELLGESIGALVEAHPDATVLLTADHGMSAKSRMVDIEGALARYGVRANAVPIIKDRYTVHHSNLGGCMFVHLAPVDVDQALTVLRGTAGVEEALPRDEAAARLRVHRERIGDIVVTGESDVVFGDPSQVALPPRLRSHGSWHETTVPLLGYNGDFDGFTFEENRDLGRYVFERVLV